MPDETLLLLYANPMEPQYWRIRMRFNGKPLEDRAWNRNVVGIGYGAWSADDLEAAIKLGSDKAGAEYLNERPRQKQLHGPDAPQKDQWCVKVRDFQTVTHFRNISLADWVYTCFSGALHFARVCSDVRSNEDPELQPEKELLKFREIKDKKSFELSRLPPIFLLLPSAGRGNVHQVGGTNLTLVKILSESGDANEACDKIARRLESEDWLSFLGPPAWESVCLSYLIVKEGFLPTGLHVGGTLKDSDIAGHNEKGELVLAQCKKDEARRPIDPRFKEACAKYKGPSKVYYFAFWRLHRGCTRAG